jgi:GcrA cell cycle regulator
MERTMTAWSDESTELLRSLWADGVSASLIALRLGHGISRNAVIGRAHRLKLARRAPSRWEYPKLTKEEQLARRRAQHIAKRLAAGAVPNARRKPPRPVAAPVASESYKGKPMSIADIGWDQCHYAISKDHPHLFCAAPGFPWCDEHRKIVWLQK